MDRTTVSSSSLTFCLLCHSYPVLLIPPSLYDRSTIRTNILTSSLATKLSLQPRLRTTGCLHWICDGPKRTSCRSCRLIPETGLHWPLGKRTRWSYAPLYDSIEVQKLTSGIEILLGTEFFWLAIWICWFYTGRDTCTRHKTSYLCIIDFAAAKVIDL
jgi:hypothetical protein